MSDKQILRICRELKNQVNRSKIKRKWKAPSPYPSNLWQHKSLWTKICSRIWKFSQTGRGFFNAYIFKTFVFLNTYIYFSIRLYLHKGLSNNGITVTFWENWGGLQNHVLGILGARKYQNITRIYEFLEMFENFSF